LPDSVSLAQFLRAGEDENMNTIIGVLFTFVVVILVLYLVNMLPLDRRAKHIVRVIVIILGIVSLPKYLVVF
jgi:type IV secretory pathway component VirB8